MIAMSSAPPSGSYAGHGFENACVPMLPEDTGDLFVQIG